MSQNYLDLKVDIDRLLNWIMMNYELPHYSNLCVAIFDNSILNNSYNRRLSIKSDAIFTIEEYCEEYYNKKNSGYSWINLQCGGVFMGKLVIVIEYPQVQGGVKEASINMSGPFKVPHTGLLDWEFEKSFQLIK